MWQWQTRNSLKWTCFLQFESMLVHADDRVVTVSLKMLYETKGKGEKERYTHLNAEFQRIPRRDKKALLSEQCEEIEENNWMGKTRDLFKKIRDTKGTFHASSVQFSCSVVSNSLLPCPSPTPGAYSNSCPSSQRCHPTILSSVIPFSCFNLSQHQGQ